MGLKKIFVVYPIFLEASWFRAQRTCVFGQTQLATINSEKENDELQRVMKNYGISRLWIGATHLEKRGRFYWTATGASLGEYTNWAVGEPNANGTERCVHARDDGGWNLEDCDVELNFACEKYERVGETATSEAASTSPLPPQQPTTTAPERTMGIDKTEEPATTVRTKRMKKVFYISDVKANWREAVLLCASNGTRLATVRNERENDELLGLMTKRRQHTDLDRLWIGASDSDEEMRFTWGTKEDPLTYENWEAGQPDHSSGVGECVQMNYFSGGWDDVSCSDEDYFACETFEEE